MKLGDRVRGVLILIDRHGIILLFLRKWIPGSVEAAGRQKVCVATKTVFFCGSSEPGAKPRPTPFLATAGWINERGGGG